MSREVKLTGRAQLDEIIKSLQQIRDTANQAEESVRSTGKKVNDTLEKSAKNTEKNIKNTSSVMRRMLNQLWGDVKALASIEAIGGSMKLTEQFRGSVKESIKLSDTVRRLGSSFGVARKDFGQFQAQLSKGLGDIGASSEAAAEALEGLKGLGVQGMESSQRLVTGAVTLAGMGGERGNERGIATGIGKAMQSMGMDINNQGGQQRLIGEVTAAVKATGKSASEILGAMDQIGSTMDKSLRGKVGPEAMTQMATIAATVGPSATKAMQEYLSKSNIERKSMEAQGVNFFDKAGNIDVQRLTKFIAEGQKRIGFDPRKAMQTFGFSEDAAEGLVRIGERSAEVERNMEALAGATRDNVEAFQKSMGMADAFRASMNRVKGNVETVFTGATQGLTNMLQGASQSNVGAAGVVAGGGLIAALLAGGGLRGLGGALRGTMGGLGKKEAFEAITGEKVQNVYVVNASEIGGSLTEGVAAGGMGGKLAGLAKKAGPAMGVVGAGMAGAAVGNYVVNPLLDRFTQGNTKEGFEGNVVERLFFKLDRLLGGETSSKFINNTQRVKVEVDSKDPNLKGKAAPSRGGSF